MTTPTQLPTDAQLRKVIGRVLDPYTRDAFKAVLPWIEYLMGIPVDIPTPTLPTLSGHGAQWYVGSGQPGTIVGSHPGDLYLDRDSGDIYSLA